LGKFKNNNSFSLLFGNYSFCYDKNLSFGYLNSENSYETLKDKKIFIEVEKKKYPVIIIEKPINQKNYKN